MSATGAIADALARAEAYSPYLSLLMGRYPEVVDRLTAGQIDTGAEFERDLPVATALRRAKARLALSLAVGDLAGLLPLDAVTQALSDFADQALDLAVADAITGHVADGEPHGLAVIALGKHGGRELNYSSDLDPILLFDPDTLPKRSREEPEEAAVRIGRRLVETMQARDADGYVFRIDLRLRPSPEVTPIVLPVEACISYYESQALAWERAAFVRARSAAGDTALGQHFLDAIRPFVWRRGVDFGAIKEMRIMSGRIRDHYASGQAFGPGFDLKRGRGGIRECEFFAQAHQLIHGGRDASLRSPSTVPALESLVAAGWIERKEADALISAYRLYRTIEHRLQMVDDRQTHELPKDAAALDNVAKLHGAHDAATLLAELEPHLKTVSRIYDGLVPDEGAQLPEDMERLEAALGDSGYDGEVASQLAQSIIEWRSGKLRAIRTPAARDAFEAVLPAIVTAFRRAPDPAGAIRRLDRMLERLPSAINLFRLIEARPALLDLMAMILSHAPTLADALSMRADLLDGLIDASALKPVGSLGDLVTRLTHPDPAADYELRLDWIRAQVGEIRFALGAQIVTGASDPHAVSRGYARLAEAAVQVAASATIAEFEKAHGVVPGGELVILALGRLGGMELTHASDLDLIYLFTGDFSVESDGTKSLGGTQYFNRLAQRVTAALSVPTAAGPLYEVDTRLRPQGNQGPLVVTLDAFERYQREDAWTWEHMALARARPVYGSAPARDAVAAIIRAELDQPRDRATLRADAAKMRGDMAEHKPPKSELDVKLASGGLVDLEFAIHVSQLSRNTGFDPDLAKAITALGFPPEIAAAHRLLSSFLVTMRLVAPDLEPPAATTRALVASACGCDDWDALLAALGEARQSVSALYDATLARKE